MPACLAKILQKVAHDFKNHSAGLWLVGNEGIEQEIEVSMVGLGLPPNSGEANGKELENDMETGCI